MTPTDPVRAGEEAPRYFFVHLQKTGGTALFQRLRDCFGPSAVYPRPDDESGVEAVTDVDHLLAELRAHEGELSMITGHFPLCTVDLLDGAFKTFTVLRDPVERTLSLLRRRHMVEARFKDLELEEIYSDQSLHAIIRNHMVKMLSLSTEEMTRTPLLATVAFDDARLERAKRNLEHNVDVIGLQESFEDFCGDLEVRFGWDLGPPRFANRTASVAVSEELRERIAAENHHDVELYAFASELVEKRRRERAALSG